MQAALASLEERVERVGKIHSIAREPHRVLDRGDDEHETLRSAEELRPEILTLLKEHKIEIGAGLGPLAGKIWRIGLMGHTARQENVTRLLAALKSILG